MTGSDKRQRGRPRDPRIWARNVERAARVIELWRGGMSIERAAEQACEERPGVSVPTFLENHWKGRGHGAPPIVEVSYWRETTRRVTSLRRDAMALANRRLDDEPEPSPEWLDNFDTPDAGEEFRADPIQRS